SLQILFRPCGEECLGQRLLELLATAVLTKNDVELADHESEELDLLIENVEDAGFDSARRREVDDVRFPLLSDAMDAADALVDHHRIARQLVVHEPVAELKVEPFGTGPRRNEDAARFATKPLEARDAVTEAQAALEDDSRPTGVARSVAYQLQRRQVLAEDDELV